MKYPLTEAQIERFRLITPLEIDGESIPFTIIQDGKTYKDIRGKAETRVFFNDYSCTVSTRYPETVDLLNRHYLSYKYRIYGEEFLKDLEAHLDKKSSIEHVRQA